MDKISKLITIFFVGSIIVLVVTHSSGFAQSAGSLFTGVNNLGTTLTGSASKGGYGTGTLWDYSLRKSPYTRHRCHMARMNTQRRKAIRHRITLVFQLACMQVAHLTRIFSTVKTT